MPTSLNHLTKPDRGDKGDPVFDALEGNIDSLDAHSHDGSAGGFDRVASSALSRGATVAVASGSWSAIGAGPYTGFYEQTISFPAGFTVANGSAYGKASIRFYLAPGAVKGDEVSPKYEKVTDTSIKIIYPNNTDDLEVEFL
jgi:hypothetical protein